jgi:hypothetical protein
VVWLAANHSQWLPLFFAVPGRLIVIALNLAGLGLSVVARRQFSRSEPLGVVWSLVVLAAACHLAGGVLWQVEGEGWQRLRMVLAGPVQTVLLAAGLAVALRIYRRSGLQGRPRFADWLPMGVAAGFAMWAIYDFLLRVPATPVSFEGAVILVDIPLLSLLLGRVYGGDTRELRGGRRGVAFRAQPGAGAAERYLLVCMVSGKCVLRSGAGLSGGGVPAGLSLRGAGRRRGPSARFRGQLTPGRSIAR